MAKILFQVEAAADRTAVVDALTTEAGIKGWWTDQARVPAATGEVMTLSFPIAPKPFELRVDETGPERVSWKHVGDFPPHWGETEVSWELTDAEGGTGTTILFRHTGWDEADERAIAHSAYTWGQLMTSLKEFAESGDAKPLFVS